MQICPEYLNEPEQEQLNREPRRAGWAAETVTCSRCGRIVESKLTFCNYCGAYRALFANNGAGAANVETSFTNNSRSAEETELDLEPLLYRNNTVFYMRGLVPTSGTFKITANKIGFMPQPLYFFKKQVVINLADVAAIENGISESCGFYLKFVTHANVTHKFSLGNMEDPNVINDLLVKLNLKLLK